MSQDKWVFYACSCKSSKWSCRELNCTVHFLWLKRKEFIVLIVKSQSHLKTKAEQNQVLFSPERTKCWDKVCSAKNDITFGLHWVQVVFFWLYFHFFSFFWCLHSLDGVYKYREHSRQNKVSNFISIKNIVPLWSTELTVPNFEHYAGWKTKTMLHHYTVARVARKYLLCIKPGPLTCSLKEKIKSKSNMSATLLTDLWLCIFSKS